jgi:hypothetical protein
MVLMFTNDFTLTELSVDRIRRRHENQSLHLWISISLVNP